MKKKEFIISLFTILILIAALYLTIGCPIRFLTGIPCFGCGMTRAWIRVLHFDFGKAFYYHPLWLCPAIFVPVYLRVRPKNKALYNGIVIGMIVLFAGTYVLRLICHSPVLEIELSQGFFYRAAVYLKDLFRAR